MCLAAHSSARSPCRCKRACSASAYAYIRLRNACRIYCSASAEHSPCLTYLIWRYKCALRRTHLREAIAIANKFASHRNPRIFGCALLAAYTVAPRQSNILVHGRSIFGDISVPCGPLICEKPLQMQASLQRIGLCVYSAAQCLPHIL